LSVCVSRAVALTLWAHEVTHGGWRMFEHETQTLKFRWKNPRKLKKRG